MFLRRVCGARVMLAGVLVVCVLAGGGVSVRARRAQQQQPQPSAQQAEAQARATKEMGELFEQAIKLEREGKYDEALPLAERIVAVAEGAFGPDGPAVATALVQHARLYVHKNEFARAAPLNRRALGIAEKTLGKDNPFLSLFLSALALVEAKLGDYERAAVLYERTLALAEKQHGAESPQLALTLVSLGDAYRHKADYARAEAALLRAVALAEKTPGGGDDELIAPLDTLAALYVERGELDRAEQIQRRTLALREKAYGPEHFLFAVGLVNAANVYRERGEYVRAEQNLQRALAVFEKALGAEDPKLAALLNNFAGLYESVGEMDRAEALLTRSLAIDEKVFGPEHIEAARDRHALANLYLRKKDYARAEPLFESALALREKILGAEHPEVATTLNGLGVLRGERKDYERATALLTRALAVREKSFGETNAQVGFTLNNLASIAFEQGDYARASALYERALKIYERTLGPRHPDTASLLNNLALLREAAGRADEALALAARGNDIREETLTVVLTTGSERRKLAFAETLAPETNYTVSLHFKALPSNPDAARLSLTTVLRRKGRALDATSGQIAALRRRLNPADRELLDKLSDARTRLAALMLNGVGQGADPAAHEAAVTKLKAEIEQLETEVSNRSAEFRAQSQPVTLARVQEAIPDSAALVELVWYRPVDARAQRLAPARYAAYVVRRGGAPAWVELGDGAEIDTAAAELRAALSDPRRDDARRLARAFDERVMRPVRKLVGDSRQLFVSPDGALNLVPFGALVDERERFLVESYSITYLTSGRDLLRLRAKVESKGGPLVVADPSFDTAATQNAATQNTTTQTTTTTTTTNETAARRSGDLADAKFTRLPGTAGEAQALGTILSGVTTLTGARATEAALKRVSGPRVLHVATHGFFLTDQSALAAQDARGIKLGKEGPAAPAGENVLLRSGLALAGANARRSDGGEDGILTALEAAGLDLWGTKLVVLSACETGLGEVKNGQGVYGLRRALVLAGSESQVMTLWQVSDEATRDLMVAYYKRLQAGEGRTEALRRVQLEMLSGRAAASGNQKRGLEGMTTDGRSAGDRRHPFYWASFIQSGDWQPMNSPAAK